MKIIAIFTFCISTVLLASTNEISTLVREDIRTRYEWSFSDADADFAAGFYVIDESLQINITGQKGNQISLNAKVNMEEWYDGPWEQGEVICKMKLEYQGSNYKIIDAKCDCFGTCENPYLDEDLD